MNNIYQKLIVGLKKKNQKALVVFAVIGDPNYNDSLEIIKAIIDGGADILEFGFPFSDPIADGPTIQSADVRALNSGINTDKCFEFIKGIRKISSLPIGLLVYYNLVYQRGVEEFYRDAKKSGVDSILIADMPIEEADNTIKIANRYELNQIFMVSPLTTGKRLINITKNGMGFLYLVSRLGVTGAREDIEINTLDLIKMVSPLTKLPLFVGFGISKPEHVRAVIKAGADGVIVGSGVVKIIEENLINKGIMLDSIKNYVNKMKKQTLITN